ncbi:hypothetical protein FDU21_04610 [Xanthomonas oryzae pv. oryzae]|nr:hypothetical protein FDU21_04610 [Xanthomonas oryzae pv. oryzae]
MRACASLLDIRTPKHARTASSGVAINSAGAISTAMHTLTSAVIAATNSCSTALKPCVAISML